MDIKTKVWFKSKKLGIDIKLTEKDITLIEQRIREGKFSGEINGHTYKVLISFSLNCSGNYETLTNPMKKAIRNRLLNYGVAENYTTAHTIVLSTGTDEGFRLSHKDLISLCKHYKKNGKTSYITVDIHTKLIWDNKEY